MKSNLPTGKYKYIKSVYIPLEESTGTCCDNCGALIANIVTVEHEHGKRYLIGKDCAVTVLKKDVIDTIERYLNSEKKLQKKIEELKRANKPFILNAKGIPCRPLETTHGYYIPY